MMRLATSLFAILLALAAPASAQECLSCWTNACPELSRTAPRCGEPSLPPSVKARAGKLSLRSEPPAHVKIDGKDAGTTPIDGIQLAPGNHVLHFEADGYEPLDGAVRLRPKETRTEKFMLRRLPDESASQHRPPPPGEEARPAAPAGLAAYAGRWSETWGTPGQTDVTYHDEYVVVVADGSVRVRGKDNQPISGEEIEGDGTLRFRLKTSFNIDYRLKPEADGVLRGTAETPSKQVPIRWERVR